MGRPFVLDFDRNRVFFQQKGHHSEKFLHKALLKYHFLHEGI